MISVRGRHWNDVGFAWDRRKTRRRFSRQRRKGAAEDREVGDDREVGGDRERNRAIRKGARRVVGQMPSEANKKGSGKSLAERRRGGRLPEGAGAAGRKTAGAILERDAERASEGLSERGLP